MADQAINALPTKTSPTTGDKMLMIGAAEEYQIDYDQLADAILNKLTSKTYTLDQGTKSFVAALNELNSKTQAGTSSTENGKGSVQFPKSFSGVPSAVATVRGTSESIVVAVKMSNVSSTGFDYIIQSIDGNGKISLPD